MSQPSAKIIASLLFTFSRQLKERLDFFASDQQRALHWGTLQFIAEQGKPQASAIASYLCITRPSVSSLLRSLERSGYISRSAGSHDKRVVHIQLRAKGRAYLQRGHNQIEREIARMMEGLEPKKRQQFVDLLQAIINYNERSL